MRTLLALITVVLLAAGASVALGDRGRRGYEVWVVDQSNTNGKASGGAIHIYDRRRHLAERIDLGGAAESLCASQTGSAPVRPHMVFFNAARTHAVLSYAASGHVLFMDAERREPVGCIDVGVQAHAAVPAPDESYVVVANQNGKLLQRIGTDYRMNRFTLEPGAALDLANGTTPSGAPRQDPTLRPDNAPICPIVDSSSRLSFVTLRGGGLFVVDGQATPMRIVAEYDKDTIHGNGCGGLEADGTMYVNSGGGTAANLSEFDVYAFSLRELSTEPSPPNTPAPRLVVSQDDREHTDSHGATLTKRGRYLWVADRSGNRIVVVDTQTDEVVEELSLTGPLSDDPSPDLLDVSPSGNRVFASLRGSIPLSGDPHASTGSTPGLYVIRVTRGGRSGEIESIRRIANVDPAGVDHADPHGLRVRALSPRWGG
ncbi:MAG: YncE family protein [Solirubrobacteraceae bacterium]